MVDRIYTQEDYDKVTRMYNDYQKTKDRYTPEQQQKIENAFSEARASVSNKIEEWNRRFVDMRWDEQWNTWWMYWDGTTVLLQAAPQPAPKPASRGTNKRQTTNKQTVDKKAVEPAKFVPTYNIADQVKVDWSRNAKYWPWYNVWMPDTPQNQWLQTYERPQIPQIKTDYPTNVNDYLNQQRNINLGNEPMFPNTTIWPVDEKNKRKNNWASPTINWIYRTY